jgi:hypothetical protein
VGICCGSRDGLIVMHYVTFVDGPSFCVTGNITSHQQYPWYNSKKKDVTRLSPLGIVDDFRPLDLLA